VLHIIKKKVEEVAIVSVEKLAGYLVALVSLRSFFLSTPCSFLALCFQQLSVRFSTFIQLGMIVRLC
jgi:hypothetical protein